MSQIEFLLPVAVVSTSDRTLPSLTLYPAGCTVTNLTVFAVLATLPEQRTTVDVGGQLEPTRCWPGY